MIRAINWFKGFDITHPHRHDVGLCGPVVIVEHHHSQHHTARHHHHDAVEVRACKSGNCGLFMLKDGKLYLSKEQRPRCLASFGRLCWGKLSTTEERWHLKPRNSYTQYLQKIPKRWYTRPCRTDSTTGTGWPGWLAWTGWLGWGIYYHIRNEWVIRLSKM